MHQIRHIATGATLTVNEYPAHKEGEWHCGNKRFTDPEGTWFVPINSISVVGFKLLFLISERIAINTAKEIDPVVQDFYRLLDDVRTDTVDLSLPAVGEMLTYLVSQDLLTEQRKADILSYRP